ncbi:hypothetical protein AKJ57_01355, partial [candidate division MSBL1 archaeon SCGC-AAA259A05]
VEEEEKEGLVENLKESLENLEKDGEEVIDEIWETDEIYEGDQLGNASDLVLVPNSGYNLRGKLSEDLFEESPLSGMHNREAFLYATDSGARLPRDPCVEDVVTLLRGRD